MSTAAPRIPGVELLDVVATGGSGLVYRGRQLAFDRPVAVKVVSAEGSDGATRRRWEREVAAVGRLSDHPNVVPVYDAGVTDDGTSYLVMPLVPDGSLGDRLRRDGPFEPEEVAAIGAKLAGALQAVHAAGVLHRDLKPDNVLCSVHGEPQLTDFGIARLQDRTATIHGDVHATISYAAPEVLAGEPATEATDVYGLGATLYALLTGQAPHPTVPGEHLAASVRRALEDDPEPLAAAGVPAGLAHVVHRALARDPAQRQPDAGRLRHELERALDEMRTAPAATRHDGTAVLAATAPLAAATAPPTRTGTRVAAPAPVPEPAEPPRRTPPPIPGPPGGPGRGSRTLWLAVLAVVALGVGLVVLAGLQDDGGDGDAATATTEPAPTSEPAAEAPETTAPPATEAEAPTTTEAEAAADADEDATGEDAAEGDAAGAAEAAVTYVETLDADRLDEAWALTTSRFQSQQDREQWEGFWEGHDVEVVGEPQVTDGGRTVVVPLTYDGQREDYRLDMAYQGGRWLVDGPVGR